MIRSDLYVFGSSILWGQGLDNRGKIHSKIIQWLDSKYSENVGCYHAAHSGAVLRGKGGSGRERLHGEVPTRWPSIQTQITTAPGSVAPRIRILIEGGINGVGIFQILDPRTTVTRLKSDIKNYCYNDLKLCLHQIDQKFPGAETFVIDYYQIITDQADLLSVQNLMDLMRLGENVKVTSGVVGKIVRNCRLFWRESSRQMRLATEEVSKNSNGNFTFVSSGFGPNDGVFGKNSLLFGIGSPDRGLRARLKHCPIAISRKRTGIHCYAASTGHPNGRGVRRYVKNIKAAIEVNL